MDAVNAAVESADRINQCACRISYIVRFLRRSRSLVDRHRPEHHYSSRFIAFLSFSISQLTSVNLHDRVLVASATVMARFAVANLQDQSAPIWITTLLSLLYTTLTILVRGFVKFGTLGFDDGAATFAQLLAYGNEVAVIYSLLHGLARSRPNDEDDEDNKLSYLEVSKTTTHLLAVRTDTDRASHYNQASYYIFWP
jgi:hypothetical protein